MLITNNTIERTKIGVLTTSTTNNTRILDINSNSIFHTKFHAIESGDPTLSVASRGTSFLKISNNTFSDTLDTRGYLKSILDCYEKRVCTRNSTGKFHEIQEWWTCDQCNINGDNNMGCCRICAETCHKGHQNLRRSVTTSGFCDCPDLRCLECLNFDKDPENKKRRNQLYLVKNFLSIQK